MHHSYRCRYSQAVATKSRLLVRQFAGGDPT